MENDSHNRSQQWIPSPHQSKLKNKRREKLITPTPQQNKKWIVFTYHTSLIRKMTNPFKQSNLRIAMRATNTTHQHLTEKSTQKKNP
jgi:hypothetical protein